MKSLRTFSQAILICALIIFSAEALSESYNWELLGPGDADQVTSLNILNNGDVVAGFDIGGVYISHDDGESWTPINNGLNNLDVTTKIIQDKDNLSTLYVGTRGGLYKSADYGKNWHRKSNGLPESKKHSLSGSIGALLIDPYNSEVIYTAMGYRPSSNGTITVQKMTWDTVIYKSFDSGETWKKIEAFEAPTKVTQLYHSPKATNTLFAATSTGLYKSTNSGLDWKRIFNKDTLNIAIDPENSDIIYASGNEEGIYKSGNGGTSWKTINSGLSFFNYKSRFKNRYAALIIDPNNNQRLYVINSTWGRTGGLYRSDDAGKNWIFISDDMPESWLKTSKRMNDLTVSKKNSKQLFLGSSRYIYTSNNSGDSWQQLISERTRNGWTHNGLNIFGQTRDILVDHKKHIYIATADHKMVKSTNLGKSWNVMFKDDKNTSNVWDIEMCANNQDRLMLVTSGVNKELCFYKSKKNDKWSKSCGIFGKSNRYEKIVASPFDCNTLFLLTRNKLYKSNDNGGTWATVPFSTETHKLFTITFDKSDKNNIYIGTDSGLFNSTDNGVTWQQLESTKELIVTSILRNKKNKQFYIGTQQSKKRYGAIYISDDNGKQWKKTLDNIVKYVTAIVSKPNDSNVLYASTMDHNYHDLSKGSGIFMSRDTGQTWQRVDQLLPVHRGYNLSVSDNMPDYVFFSSAGSGAYQLKINDTE